MWERFSIFLDVQRIVLFQRLNGLYERAIAINQERVGRLPLHADAVAKHGGWPRKFPIFGVEVSVTDYGEAARSILKAAREKVPAIVAHVNVHLLVAASDDRSLGNQLNSFDIAAPDGQPVRWALNHFHRTGLSDTVTGPDLMLILCREVAESGVCIYLYGGSSPEVVDRLIFNLRSLFPLLNIVGYESPPFRALTPKEGRGVVERINTSGAGIVFIGLGAPKQERFAYEHRDEIKAVRSASGQRSITIPGSERESRSGLENAGSSGFSASSRTLVVFGCVTLRPTPSFFGKSSFRLPVEGKKVVLLNGSTGKFFSFGECGRKRVENALEWRYEAQISRLSKSDFLRGSQT